ncbi:MAG: PEP-CTERM sorting domain-containing protein [Planctomycetes bacterium]|nr:PEP-CTERM sorting domain-containing protein [Planctomycetota bacterium]
MRFELLGERAVGSIVEPEPSSFVLAGLGLTALLIFRRRRSRR